MIEFLKSLPFKTFVGVLLCGLFSCYWIAPRLHWLIGSLGLLVGPANTRSRQGIPGGLSLGIPFVLGISLLLLLRNQVSAYMYVAPYQTRGLVFGCIIALAFGFFLDTVKNHWIVRISLQSGLGFFAFYHGFRFFPPANPYALESIDLSALTLSMLWIVGIINVFELFERATGKLLYGALLPAIGLLSTAFIFDKFREIAICCLLLGILLGLASQNTKNTSIGSTGALFLGYVMAITAMQTGILYELEPLAIVLLAPILITLLFVVVPTFRVLVLPKMAIPRNTRFRALFHHKEAACLRIATSDSPDEIWNWTTRAARDLGFESLVHYSSFGEKLRHWDGSDDNPSESISLHLSHSGGEVTTTRPSERDATATNLLIEVVDAFDSKLELFNQRDVLERTNHIRLLVVNRHYGGTSATGQIVQDLAEDLTADGIAVTVLAGSVKYEGPHPIVGRNEILQGVHVRRVPGTYFGRSSHLRNIVDMAFFYAFSACWIVGIPKSQYTHLMVLTDPPLIGFLGPIGKRLKHWRFVYNIHDLYPDIALALEVLRPGLVYRVFERVNSGILKQADLILCVGQHLAMYLTKYAPSGRIDTIRNWADGNMICPSKTAVNAQEKLGLRDCFTVIYAGNLGPAQDMDVIIDLMNSFKKSDTVQFLFVGVGTRRDALTDIVRLDGLKNVTIVGYVPRRKLNDYLAIADIGLVSLSPKIQGMALPTKTYSYLAAGLPVLAIAESSPDWEFLSFANLGAVFSPRRLDSITKYISDVANGEVTFDHKRIRAYFEHHFDRKIQTTRYSDALQHIENHPTLDITRERAAELSRHEN